MKGFGNGVVVVVVVIREDEKLKSLREIIGYEKVENITFNLRHSFRSNG
jgi:hypothetical protein